MCFLTTRAKTTAFDVAIKVTLYGDCADSETNMTVVMDMNDPAKPVIPEASKEDPAQLKAIPSVPLVPHGLLRRFLGGQRNWKLSIF